MHRYLKQALWGIASLSVLAGLNACGGGGGGATTPPAAITGSQTGILTDAAVQGVSYRTSSGVTGVTDAQGRYNFNLGDTVQFTLGGLTLGNVTATGIISPIQLAGSDSNKLTNLLVLLQSLDTDGNPNNGITIPAAGASAVPSSMNLSQTTSTFASGSNTALVSSMQAGGITRTVTTQASATAHFTQQGMALLSSNVLVMYDDVSAVMIRFMPNGAYLQGQASPDSYCGANGECGANLIEKAGSERGVATVTGFTVDGYQVTATQVIDNNIQSGLSHPISCDTGLLPNGEGIISNGTCQDSGALINKAPNNNATIVGVWALDTATSADTQHFVFLPNGKYLMVDPLGDTDVPSCGGPGVEFGSYSWNSTTGALTISAVTYDTNSCAGLHDILGTRRIGSNGTTPVLSGSQTLETNYSIAVSINAGGLTATVTSNEPGFTSATLHRVSK